MTDPERVALMSLLMHCIPPAYQVNPELFALICCKMVSLSIEHGNCPMSAKGYGSFAAILSGIVGNYRDGDRFGKLGVDLCERLNDVTVRSACHFTWAAFASAWVRPVDESIASIATACAGAWRAAIIRTPRTAPRWPSRNIMFRGTPLSVTRKETAEALQLLQRIGDPTNLALVRTRLRFAEWLASDASRSSLDEDGFDEAATLRDLQAVSVSKSMLAHFQSVRVMHRYFAGEYAEAWKISQQLDELLMFVPGMMTVVEHAFFQCLSATALWSQVHGEERAAARGTARCATARARNLGDELPVQLRAAAPAPWRRNARALRGEAAQAGELYERAIAAARESRFPHVEAIASELAMHHWRPRDAARAETLRAARHHGLRSLGRDAQGERPARDEHQSSERILMLR